MRRRLCPAEGGIALISVTVLLFVVVGSSLLLVWFMNQQQTAVGTRLRAVAAAAVAESGVHWVLAILESVAPDGSGPGRAWRTAGHSEMIQVGPFHGRFTVSLVDEADGAIVVTSVGETGGVVRRLRARVYLASPALLAGLYAASVVRLERPPAATFILPYGAGGRDRPWVHIGAGQGVWLPSTDVALNASSLTFHADPGPVDGAGEVTGSATPPRPAPVRFLLARGADLALGPDRQPVDVQQLRVMGLNVDRDVARIVAPPGLPQVDRAYYQALAAANTDNATLNEAVGRYHGDGDLARKRDSLYSLAQFEKLLSYLRAGLRAPRLTGVIYLTGELTLSDRQRLEVADGTLVAEGVVQVSNGASLAITHSAGTRTLAGLLVLNDGALAVTHGARLRVHGLVYVSRVIALGAGAHVDIVGSMLSGDPVLAFRNFGATVVIRYDPAVLGTRGLRMPPDAPVVAWVAAWEEPP